MSKNETLYRVQRTVATFTENGRQKKLVYETLGEGLTFAKAQAMKAKAETEQAEDLLSGKVTFGLVLDHERNKPAEPVSQIAKLEARIAELEGKKTPPKPAQPDDLEAIARQAETRGNA